MTIKDEALKLARKALEKFHYTMIDAGVLDKQEVLNQGLTAAIKIDEALAQPEQEPVAWMHEWEDGERTPLLHGDVNDDDCPISVRPLVYGDITPPQRKPLTIERIEGIWREVTIESLHDARIRFARALEAAHGIKE